MITVKDLSFSYGGHIVFDAINLFIGRGQKVGIVGPNGAGKSTLLSLISQNRQTDIGSVQVLGAIASVPQEIKHDPILDACTTTREYIDPSLKHHDFELKKMMTGLELANLDLESDPKVLSGGQKTRLAIARALLLEPDILILDEPTNFLDTSGKRWIMNFLSTYPNTVIIISHDMALLDHSIDKILFIETQSKKIEEYKGNYTQFLKLREEKIALIKKQVKSASAHIQSMEAGLRMGTQSVKQRIQLQKRIEREKTNLPDLPTEAVGLRNIKLPEPTRSGQIPINIKHVYKAYGDKPILDDINFYLERGERMALIGQNGAGKSTLIKILVGLSKPDRGEVIRDSALKLGYYSQEHELFDLTKNVMETFREISKMPDGYIRSVLGKFMFPEQKTYQTIGSLSGGEKTRLAIALLVLQDYNLLILDEPTTYLDVTSQRVILEALKQYKGAMIVVSHTEAFISELEPSRVLLLPENKIDFWHKDYLKRVSEI